MKIETYDGKYKPRKPTKAQMGFSARDYLTWMVCDVSEVLDGDEAYSNGHILDVNRPTYDSEDAHWLKEITDVKTMVSEALERNTTRAHLIGFIIDAGGGLDTAVLLPGDDEDDPVILDKKYVDYFLSRYEDVQFYVAGEERAKRPVLVHRGGSGFGLGSAFVGLIMPLNAEAEYRRTVEQLIRNSRTLRWTKRPKGKG